jgi:hypothetical protein
VPVLVSPSQPSNHPCQPPTRVAAVSWHRGPRHPSPEKSTSALIRPNGFWELPSVRCGAEVKPRCRCRGRSRWPAPRERDYEKTLGEGVVLRGAGAGAGGGSREGHATGASPN